MANKILIVDDEKGLTAELETWLSEYDYDVVTARDGVEGFQKAKSEKPDLIIMDVLMPGMSGYQVVDEIRNRGEEIKDIPVIMISGRPSMKNYFDDSRAYAFLPKPFNQEVLLSKIKEALKRAESSITTTSTPTGGNLVADKLLIVGVEDYLLRKVKGILEERGFVVELAFDEEEALEKARGSSPAVVFGQFWEGCTNLDTPRIYRELKNTPETQAIRFVTFCGNNVGMEAWQVMRSTEIIHYSESADLASKIEAFVKKISG